MSDRSVVNVVDRASRDAALTLGLAGSADVLLYVLLPLHHETFGVSLAEAGLLLAANRLVRIAGYGRVARLYARRGPRVACVLAASAAAVAALGYAVLSGVWALLVARLVWGLCFAAFNIAAQALPTAELAGASRRSGRARSVTSLCLVTGLIVGTIVAEAAGPRAPFFVLALAALAAVPFARRLPGPEAGGADLPVGPRLARPTRLDLWSFAQGATLDGLFVVGLGVLAGEAFPGEAALAAGSAMALRYASEIFLSPVGGAVAERHGPKRVLVALSLASAAGLALVGAGPLWVGAAGVALLRGLLNPLSAPVAAAASPGPARVPALARLATWRDIGAGLGPLLAGILLPVVPAPALYGAAAMLLAATALAVAAERTGSPERRRV